MLESQGRQVTEGCLFFIMDLRDLGTREGALPIPGDFTEKRTQAWGQDKDCGIRTGKRCGKLSERGLGVASQGWAGAAAPERRAGFRTQRLGFNPQTCHFCSLCDQDSMVKLSDAWFPYLERRVMRTILHEVRGGGGESNQILFAHVEIFLQIRRAH